MTDQPITKEELDEWRKLCDEATEGPWCVDEIEDHYDEPYVCSRGVRSKKGGLNKGEEFELFDENDADFIATARTAMLRLLDENAKLRERVEELEAKIKHDKDWAQI